MLVESTISSLTPAVAPLAEVGSPSRNTSHWKWRSAPSKPLELGRAHLEQPTSSTATDSLLPHRRQPTQTVNPAADVGHSSREPAATDSQVFIEEEGSDRSLSGCSS